MPDRTGQGDVAQLVERRGGAQHQAAAAHVPPADEVCGNTSRSPKIPCKTSTYFADAMLPSRTTSQSGPMSGQSRGRCARAAAYTRGCPPTRPRSERPQRVQRHERVRRRRPAVGVMTKMPVPEIDESGSGGPHESACVRQFAAEVQATQEAEHLAKRRAGVAQPQREIERRPVRHDHRSPPSATICRR